MLDIVREGYNSVLAEMNERMFKEMAVPILLNRGWLKVDENRYTKTFGDNVKLKIDVVYELEAVKNMEWSCSYGRIELECDDHHAFIDEMLATQRADPFGVIKNSKDWFVTSIKRIFEPSKVLTDLFADSLTKIVGKPKRIYLASTGIAHGTSYPYWIGFLDPTCELWILSEKVCWERYGKPSVEAVLNFISGGLVPLRYEKSWDINYIGNGTIQAPENYATIAHELLHYFIASPSERKRKDFGLNPMSTDNAYRREFGVLILHDLLINHAVTNLGVSPLAWLVCRDLPYHNFWHEFFYDAYCMDEMNHTIYKAGAKKAKKAFDEMSDDVKNSLAKAITTYAKEFQ
jgi:hypothetical protein